MTYVSAHPYACANVTSVQSQSQRRPKRPTVATRGIHTIHEHEVPAQSTSTSAQAHEQKQGPGTSLSPSPITFARASFISIRRGSDESTITGVRIHDDDNDDENTNPDSSTTDNTTTAPIGVIAAALERSDFPDRLTRDRAHDAQARARLSALLQRAAEASPRAARARPLAPEVVLPARSPGAESVTLTIEGVSVALDFPKPPSAPASPVRGPKEGRRVCSPVPAVRKDDARSETVRRCRSQSPSTTVTASPSTPGFPLTPAGSEDGFDIPLPAVAPLAISKPHSRSGSPFAPASASASSSLAGSPANPSGVPQPTSPTPSPSSRTHAKIAARRHQKRLSRLFANGPAPLDTVRANCAKNDDSPVQQLTLTGVLAEVAAEAARAAHEREAGEAFKALQLQNRNREGEDVNVMEEIEAIEEVDGNADADDSAWVDLEPDAEDDDEGRDYYRSDIATHLRLFSSLSPFAGSTSFAADAAAAGAGLHRRGSSSSSFNARQHQLPPARPDSLPPPPHARLPSVQEDDAVDADVRPVLLLPPPPPSSFNFYDPEPEPESEPAPLPVSTFPGLNLNATLTLSAASGSASYARRGSAASIASTTSARSTGSQKSGRNVAATSSTVRRGSRARLSASVNVGRRRRGSGGAVGGASGGGGRMKSLPPTPTSSALSTSATSPLYVMAADVVGPSAFFDPTFALAPAPKPATARQREPRSQRAPRVSRPPPRFSLPIDVAGEDEVEALSPRVSRRPSDGLGGGNGTTLTAMVEVDEEDRNEDNMEATGRHPFARASPSAWKGGRRAPPVQAPAPPPRRSPRAAVASLKPIMTTAPPTGSQGASAFLFVPGSPLMLPSPSPPPPMSPTSPGSPTQSVMPPFTASTMASKQEVWSRASGEETGDDSSTINAHDGAGKIVDEEEREDDDTDSVLHDGAGRVLRSRWSASTFASTAITPGPTSSRFGSASRPGFFPRLPSFPQALQLPARLKRTTSPRSSAERERPVLGGRSVTAPAVAAAAASQQTQTQTQPQILPFPFFPTPTPPSPKRATNPGPGRYVPKPELRPPPPPSRPPPAGRAKTDFVSTQVREEKGRTSLESNGTGAGPAQYARYRTPTVTSVGATLTSNSSAGQPSPAPSTTSYATTSSSLSLPFSFHSHSSNSTGSSGSGSGSSRPLLLALTSPTTPGAPGSPEEDALSAFPFTLSGSVAELSPGPGLGARSPGSSSGFSSLGFGANAGRKSTSDRDRERNRNRNRGAGVSAKPKELVSLRGKPVPSEILTW